MSITILEPLARALHTTPAELCGWDSMPPDSILSESEKQLIEDFRLLNPVGQEKAAGTVHDLTEIPRYRADSINEESPLPEETAPSSA